MQLTFLAASDGTRMAKSFALSSGIFVTTPYPHVRRFWSFTRNAAASTSSTPCWSPMPRPDTAC